QDARAAGQVRQGRLEEAQQVDQLFGAGQVAGVEHQGLELAGTGPAGQLAQTVAVGEQVAAQALEAGGQGAGQGAAAQQDGPVHRARTAADPALQRGRTRQADGADQAASKGGVGEFQVTVGHGRDSGRGQNGVHTTCWNAARIDRTDRSSGESANATAIRPASLQPPQPTPRSRSWPSCAGSPSLAATAFPSPVPIPSTPPPATRRCSPRPWKAWSSASTCTASAWARWSPARCSSTRATSTSPANACSARACRRGPRPTTSSRPAAPAWKPPSWWPTRSPSARSNAASPAVWTPPRTRPSASTRGCGAFCWKPIAASPPAPR